MNIVERTKLILEILKDKDYMMVDDIAELTNVSKATIRRDLQDLEKANKVRRFRGGVCLVDSSMVDNYSPINDNLNILKDEKISISKYAASLIEDNDVIFLDGGSTICYMIDYIEAKRIKVVTNSIHNAMKLAERQIDTYILAGDVQNDSLSVVGQDTVDRVKVMNFDKAFLGTRGIDATAGLSTSDSFDEAMKSTVIARSKENFVLADHSKFGIRKFYTFSDLSSVTIITDQGAVCEDMKVAVRKV